MRPRHLSSVFFFFNDTATTEIYTLSLHDALPICRARAALPEGRYAERSGRRCVRHGTDRRRAHPARSEEHTSELQSPCNLVCRLLLEKKKKMITSTAASHIQSTFQSHMAHQVRQ